MAEYEPIQPQFLIALATKARCVTFLDIGANIGAYSVFASTIPTVRRIIAFEANPKAAREIATNAQLNGLSIEVREQAVSNRSGELTFGLVSDLAGNNGVLSSALHDGFRQTIIVPAVPLDDLTDVDGPICLKIDVEGHEVAVVEGAVNLLTSRKCVIQTESFTSDAGRLLSDLGYRHLTRIGPDAYHTNISGLKAIDAYEQAMEALIEERHRAKTTTIKRGDISINLTGRTSERARAVARRIFGSRL